MEKITGLFDYQIYVDCPNEDCGEYIDIVPLEEDGELGVIFGGERTLGRWHDLGLRFKCPECGTEFELDKIEC